MLIVRLVEEHVLAVTALMHRWAMQVVCLSGIYPWAGRANMKEFWLWRRMARQRVLCSSQRMLQVDTCMRFPALSKQLSSGHHAGYMLLHALVGL